MKIQNYNIFYTIFIFLVLLLVIIIVFNGKETFQIKNDLHLITPDVNNIFLFWEGSIKNMRLELLKMAIKSTYYYNPNKKIYLFSNSLKNDKRINDINKMCKVIRYDFESLISNTFLDKKEKIYIYKNYQKDPRLFSDFFRFVVLYKFGGTYTDTDNLCFRKIPNIKNVITRTYDKHYAHNDKILDKLIDGKYKYNGLYSDIPFTIRNDNWLNIQPKNNYIKLILESDVLYENNKPLYISNTKSWQNHIQTIAYDNLEIVSKENKFGLNLIYFFDGFLKHTCNEDLCLKNDFYGEMCELYKQLPNIKNEKWGTYKTNKHNSLEMLKKIEKQFPTSCYIWMATKEKELIDDKVYGHEIINNPQHKKKIKSWIYQNIKEKINF